MLAADLLQAAINDAHIKGLIQMPIPMINNEYPVIQYADDTVVVMPASIEQAVHMKRTLQDYTTSVGLRINFQNSTMVPMNISSDQTTLLAELFGCEIGRMPFTFLGLPMGTIRPTVLDLMPLVASVERRLTTSSSLLDYGPKLTLVNSVITSLAIYAMCSIKIPPKILEHLDKLRMHCLWSKKSEDGCKSNSLAARDLVCRPKT